MKVVKSNWEIIPQKEGIVGMKQQCEYAGRLCYHSEDKITDTSYLDLFNTFDTKGHFSPYAHGTVTMRMHRQKYITEICDKLNPKTFKNGVTYMEHFLNPMWTRLKFIDDYWYITTNYRVIHELGLDEVMNVYWCEPTEYHTKRISVKIQFQRIQGESLNRHATGLAICEQSTRYCVFTKKKFNGEITIAEPYWFQNAIKEVQSTYLNHCQNAEDAYKLLIENGLNGQDARGVLPVDLATVAMYTGFVDAWEHVFDLRTTKAAHPDMVAVMKPLATEFKLRGFIDKTYE